MAKLKMEKINQVGNSQEDIVKAIKRINERRASIARAVQKKQLPKVALTRYDEAILAAVKDPRLLTKSGAISHGTQAVNAVSPSDLRGLLRRNTVAEEKMLFKKSFKEQQEQEQEQFWDEYDEDYQEEDSGEYTYDDYIDDVNDVNDALEDNYSETYDVFDRAFRGTRGKKTYRQLNQVLQGSKLPKQAQVNIDEPYFT